MFVFFADLTENPAHGFMDQVVRVVLEKVGNREGILELTLFHEMHTGDHGDALFPEVIFFCPVVKELFVLVEKPMPQNLVTAKVNEIPVVDGVYLTHVEIHASLSGCVVFEFGVTIG